MKCSSHMGSPMNRRQNDTTENLTFVTLLPGGNKTFFYYRPQRNCGKVMLLHLSVSHSVHGGVYLSMHWGRHPLADTPPGRHPPGRYPPGQKPRWADTPLVRHPPRKKPTPLPPTATAADGTHPTGMHFYLFA